MKFTVLKSQFPVNPSQPPLNRQFRGNQVLNPRDEIFLPLKWSNMNYYNEKNNSNEFNKNIIYYII